MGQKANPIGNRLGIIRGWDSNWFGGKDFAAKVVEDQRIRDYMHARLSKGGLARVVIERSLKRVTVTIHTSRPGTVIGKGGSEVEYIRAELKKLTGKDIQINILEIRKPELDAAIVGEGIAKQLEMRVNYRRAIKMAIQATMRTPGAEGIKVRISGRLNGADIARSEEFKEGKTPLHTFRSDIDYSWQEAQTVYGKIGIKTWICRGEVLGKRDLSPMVAQQASGKPVGGGPGGGPGSGYGRSGEGRNERGGDRRDGNRRRGSGGGSGEGRNQRRR